MELKELTDKTLELFGVTSPEQLGPALLAACGDPDKLRTFPRARRRRPERRLDAEERYPDPHEQDSSEAPRI